MSRSGLVVVDKSAGMTSHDVVSRIRRLARTRRVGHAGTLDPMATGVLVIGVERATRLLTYLVGSDKSYHATVRLGEATLTDDAEGEVLTRAPVGGLTEAAVRAAAGRFVGQIDQVPSAVSAIKVGGVRSYARVRAGQAVTLAARRVNIARLTVTGLRPAPDGATLDLDIEVDCSTGTYIRAIARDLGAGLGVGGHLTALRRTAVGGFTLAQAVTLADLADRAEPVALSLADAARLLFPRRTADDQEAGVLAHGGTLAPIGITGPYAVFAPDGVLIAIVVERDGRARAEAVLAPAGGPRTDERAGERAGERADDR